MPRSLYANPKHGCSCTRLHVDTQPHAHVPPPYTCRCAVHPMCLHTLHVRVKPRTLVDAEGWCFRRGLREMLVLVWTKGKMYLRSRVRGWQFPWPPAQSHAEGAAWPRGRTGRGRGHRGHGRRSQVGAALLSQLCAATWLCGRKGPSPACPGSGVPVLSYAPSPAPLLLGVAPASLAPRFHTSLLGEDPEHHQLGAEG